MVKRIVLISGPVASGKSTLARVLSSRFEMDIVQTRKILLRMLSEGSSPSRYDLQAEGERLDRITDGSWVRDELIHRLRNVPCKTSVVVDSVRRSDQIVSIKESYGAAVSHIHLTAPLEVLEERYRKRLACIGRKESAPTYRDVRNNPN